MEKKHVPVVGNASCCFVLSCRFARIVVASNRSGEAVTAEDLVSPRYCLSLGVLTSSTSKYQSVECQQLVT